MEIHLTDLSKRFNREWIFHELNYKFLSNKIYAIVGPNGSGKSTLIRIISGQMPFTSGKINYSSGGIIISSENIYREISIAAPYMELIEELTLEEIWKFHFKFKNGPLINDTDEVIQILGLEKGRGKVIKNYSSGMKQRLKLGLAFFSDTELLLLDEPTSNLDENGMQMYLKLIENWKSNRTILIGSNQLQEYQMCDGKLDIIEFSKN
ncbi:ABC transporter ATP-binding protein [Peijinzhouia sedimentorum]